MQLQTTLGCQLLKYALRLWTSTLHHYMLALQQQQVATLGIYCDMLPGTRTAAASAAVIAVSAAGTAAAAAAADIVTASCAESRMVL
jgi:hypothetical protein